MEPEQQPCSNCGNNFPTDKIDLHEAYCARNMRKCQLCGIFIDVRETEQHQVSCWANQGIASSKATMPVL